MNKHYVKYNDKEIKLLLSESIDNLSILHYTKLKLFIEDDTVLQMLPAYYNSQKYIFQIYNLLGREKFDELYDKCAEELVDLYKLRCVGDFPDITSEPNLYSFIKDYLNEIKNKIINHFENEFNNNIENYAVNGILIEKEN